MVPLMTFENMLSPQIFMCKTHHKYDCCLWESKTLFMFMNNHYTEYRDLSTGRGWVLVWGRYWWKLCRTRSCPGPPALASLFSVPLHEWKTSLLSRPYSISKGLIFLSEFVILLTTYLFFLSSYFHTMYLSSTRFIAYLIVLIWMGNEQLPEK